MLFAIGSTFSCPQAQRDKTESGTAVPPGFRGLLLRPCCVGRSRLQLCLPLVQPSPLMQERRLLSVKQFTPRQKKSGRVAPLGPLSAMSRLRQPRLEHPGRYRKSAFSLAPAWRNAGSKACRNGVRIDPVLGISPADVPLRPDRPQPELPHQPPDALAANRNPCSNSVTFGRRLP
jgi:hypothetical protein